MTYRSECTVRVESRLCKARQAGPEGCRSWQIQWHRTGLRRRFFYLNEIIPVMDVIGSLVAFAGENENHCVV